MQCAFWHLETHSILDDTAVQAALQLCVNQRMPCAILSHIFRSRALQMMPHTIDSKAHSADDCATTVGMQDLFMQGSDSDVSIEQAHLVLCRMDAADIEAGPAILDLDNVRQTAHPSNAVRHVPAAPPSIMIRHCQTSAAPAATL